MSAAKRLLPQHHHNDSHPYTPLAILPTPPKRPRMGAPPASQPCPISDCFDLSLKLYVNGLYVHGLLYQFAHSLVPRLRSKGGVVPPLDPQVTHGFVRTFLRCEWERGKIPLLLTAHWPPRPLSAQDLAPQPGEELPAAERTRKRCQVGSPDKGQGSSAVPGPGPSSPVVGNVNAECDKLVDESDQKEDLVTALRLDRVSCSDKSVQTEDSAVKADSKNVCVFCGQFRENGPLTVTSEKDVGLSQLVPDTIAETKLAHGLENSSVEAIVEDKKLERYGPGDIAEQSGDAYVKPEATVPRHGGDVATAQTFTNSTQASGDTKKPADWTRPTRRGNLIQLTTGHHATLDIQTGGNVSRPGESQTTNHSGRMHLKDTELQHSAVAGHVDIARQVPGMTHPVPLSETHENTLQDGEDSAQVVAAQAGQDVAQALGGVPHGTIKDAYFQNKQADNRTCPPVLTDAMTGQSMSLSAEGNQLQSSQHVGIRMQCVMRARSPVSSQYRFGDVSNMQRFGHCSRALPWIAGRFAHHGPQRFRNPFGGQNHPRFLRSAPNPQNCPRFHAQTGPGLNKHLPNCERMGPGPQNIPRLLTSRTPGKGPNLGGGIQPTLIHPLISILQNNPRLAGAVHNDLRCPRPGGGQLTKTMLGPFPQRPEGNPAQRVCVVPPSLGANSATRQGMAIPTRPPPCDQPAKLDQQPAFGSEGPLTELEVAGRHTEGNRIHMTGLHMQHSANNPWVSASLVTANCDALSASQASHPAPTRSLSNMQDAGLSIGDMPVNINNQAGVVISSSPRCGGNTTQGCVQTDSTYAAATHGEHLAGGGEWNPQGFSEPLFTAASVQTPAGNGGGIVAPDGMFNRNAWTGIVQQSHSAVKHQTPASHQNDGALNPVFHPAVSEGQQRNVTGDGCIAVDQALPFAGTAVCVGEQDHGSNPLQADRTAGRVTDDLAMVTSGDGNRACCHSDDRGGMEPYPFQNQSSACTATPSEPTTSHEAFDNHLSSKFHTPQTSAPFQPSTADCCQSTETNENHADSDVFSDSIERHADTMSFDRSEKHAKDGIHKQRPTDCQQSFDSSVGQTDNGSSIEIHTDNTQSSDSSGGHTDTGKHSEKQSSEIRETKSDAEGRPQPSHKKGEPQTTSGQIQKIVGQIQLIVGQLYGDKHIKSSQAPGSAHLSRLSADLTTPEQLKEKTGSDKSSSVQTATSSHVKATNRLITAEKMRLLNTKMASVQTQHTSTADKRHKGTVTDTPDTRTRWTMTTPPARVSRRLMTDLPPTSDAASWTERLGYREASTETYRWPTNDRWTLTRCHQSVISRACQAALPEQQHAQTCTEPSAPSVKAEKATMTGSTRCHQATMTEETPCAHQRKQSQWTETQTAVGAGAGSESRVAVGDGEGSGGTEGTVKITIRLRMGSGCQARLLGPQ